MLSTEEATPGPASIDTTFRCVHGSSATKHGDIMGMNEYDVYIWWVYLWHLSILIYIYSMTYYMTNIVDGRCGWTWLRFMIFCDVCWNLAQSSQLKSALQAQLGTRMFSNRFLSSSIVRSNLEISSWPSMQNHIMNSWRPSSQSSQSSSSSSPTIHSEIDHEKKIELGQESIIFHQSTKMSIHFAKVLHASSLLSLGYLLQMRDFFRISCRAVGVRRVFVGHSTSRTRQDIGVNPYTPSILESWWIQTKWKSL